MQRAAVFSESGLQELLGRVCEKTRLMAPVRRGKTSFEFQWISNPREVQSSYVRTVLSPKKAFMPPRETILDFTRGPNQGASPHLEQEPFVLFGIHPCDLTAVNQLDWAMGQRHGVEDPSYLARRAAATIVALDCLPDEYCFCTSVGSCHTRKGADVFLTPVETGFYAEALTDKGAKLLEGAARREPTAGEEAEAKAFPDEKERRTTTKINAGMAELPDLLEPSYHSAVFENTALRCYSCGTCTNVCPTCFCFDVDDEVNLPLTMGTRWRKYDSCQFLDFAVVAGGHNFRRERKDRVRHRWFRKFVYLLREHGMPFCVGCGRCSQACTAGISLVDVLNSVLAEAREGVAR
jgi:sulfhydrogenase subunit beta (sulfur reductase)